MQYEEKQLRKIIREEIVNECLLSNFESEVYDIIKESLGISNSITKFISQNKQTLFDTAISNVGTGTIDDNKVEKHVSSIKLPAFVKDYKSHSGEQKTIQHTILFTIYTYNFQSRKQYETLKDEYITTEGKSSTDGKSYDWITIYTYAIQGRLHKPTFINTLGHELSHVFKQDMAMRSIPKNDKKYLKAIGNIYSNEDVERCIAKVFYYGEKLEQEGFANGLYYKFKEGDLHAPSWDEFQKTDEWGIYLWFKKAVEFLKGKQSEVQEVLNDYYNGMEFRTLIKNAERAMENFKRRLVRILWKFHEELLSEGVSFRGGNYALFLIS